LLLLHKRLDNHKWDHSSAGHFPYDQDYLEAAQREFEEELGIRLDKSHFKEVAYKKIFKELPHGQINYRFVKVYLVEEEISTDKFNFDIGEIEEIRYFDKKAIQTLFEHSEQVTSSAMELIKEYFLKML
jgi:8-oxo-dGTP pyrophosphatase MutT (NUDIX family)